MAPEVFHPLAQSSLILSEGQAHIWRASLDWPESQLGQFEEVLTADERERAARFRLHRDRKRFITARGLLRDILSRYVNRKPYDLRFHYGPYGKPALDESVENRVRFNVSHSGSLALFAITCGREVGIDVEAVRDDFDVEKIAEDHFNPQERAIFRAAPAEKKREAFFTCWSLKEAYLKALGWGFAAPPERLEFSALRELPDRNKDFALGGPGDIQWWARRFIPHYGYVAALVTEGRCEEVSYWQWPDGERIQDLGIGI